MASGVESFDAFAFVEKLTSLSKFLLECSREHSSVCPWPEEDHWACDVDPRVRFTEGGMFFTRLLCKRVTGGHIFGTL